MIPQLFHETTLTLVLGNFPTFLSLCLENINCIEIDILLFVKILRIIFRVFLHVCKQNDLHIYSITKANCPSSG